MESQVELPQGYEIVEEEKQELPEGYEVVGEAPEYTDVVSKNLREQGYEPDFSEELERASEHGQRQFWLGFKKGATDIVPKPLQGAIGLLPEPEPGFAASAGEFAGSTIPISQYLKGSKVLYNAAQKSPYFKKTLGALGNLTGAFLGGAGYEASKDIAKGELPDVNTVLEHGAEWALLDIALRAAGAGGSFAVNLLKKSKETGQPEWKVVNEVYNTLKEQGVDVSKDARIEAKALSVLEDIGKETPKDLRKTVTPKKVESMQKSVDDLAQPIPEPQPESLNVNRVVEDVERKAIEDRIASVGKESIDEAALGGKVQKGIEKAKKLAKEEYKPYYDVVEQETASIVADPTSTARVAGELIQVLEELKTRPAGYSTVINTIEDVLKDIGYVVQRDKSTGAIEHILKETEPSLNKLIELGRRLNEVVEYDVLDRTVKDRINPVVRAVKNDIKEALGNVSEDLRASWELAEEAFGVNARKFGRDSIRKIRSNQSLENIPRTVESATALNDLRAVLPPAEMRDVERNLLDRMNRMSEGKAKDFLRKVRSGLSKESQQIADDIVQSKKPINKQSIESRRDRLAEAVDEDLASSMNTGKRPNKTLELWQNPRGRKLVKESLETHPQKKELIKYLENQTLQDMAQSIVNKNGGIDAAKLKQLMENPAIRSNLRELGGEEAVNFFENLAQETEKFKRNAEKLVTEKLGVKKGTEYEVTPHGQIKYKVDTASKGERGKQLIKRGVEHTFPLASKIQKALDSLGFTGKVTLNLFTLIKFGFLKGALVPIGVNAVKKLATSSKARHAFKKVAQQQHDPIAFIAAVEELGKALEED